METTPEQHTTNPYERERSKVAPMIYVASLADYNNGRLHGEWLDPTQELDDLQAAVTRMLSKSKEYDAEEFAIHDYEGFYDFRVGEYDRLDTVHRIACGIAEHGEAFAAYVDLVGTEEASLDGFEDNYHGSYTSTGTFIDEYVDAMGWNEELEKIRERTGLGSYLTIDTDGLGSALRSEWSVVDGSEGVHVFYP
ncbi:MULTISPECIES: antirestriction protein ArdA [unclassified Gordonia (in: high G+C Gram-positive bacteria)]|uniref:antirestriction protein ArdA n=1 Tax=unclassified Gordonia (in: high G+C Gram-positive bacteria) TaxID=2657482 RepID=UPI00071D21EA|nr:MULTISPECIES: antirestriction protein ArdA [unclassified Gordonia (in: high G+C Gram-positive bacteria)]KSU53332.1 hypothetical protein AS181_22130 [Gordonia sp. SGD-V-85]SCC56120.1 Antirestriction protein [Gordonia sp. v-85]